MQPDGQRACEPRGTGDTRASVIAAAARLDERAWEQFFDIYGPVVYRYARRQGLAHADSEEAVAIVMRNFLSAFRNGFVYSPSKGRFRHYIGRVAKHAIIAIRAKQSAWLPLERAGFACAAEPVSDEALRDTERQERLRACLDRLRASGEVALRDLAIFEQVALQDDDPAHVAARFGLSVSRVYGIKHETLRRIRALYRGLNRVLGEI